MPPEDKSYALFLDFDGTLADIAAKPDNVIVDPGLGEILHSLQEKLGGALAVISGRRLDDLDHYPQLHDLDAAGLHGLELRIGEEKILVALKSSAFEKVKRDLEKEITELPGVLLEDKGFAIALHWRNAPEHEDALRKLAENAQNFLGDNYRLQEGKCVIEILSADISKAHAIDRFLEAPPYADRTPIFIGDDLTDEAGFELVNRLEGLSIFVGDGETAAHYSLASPHSVRALLAEWASEGIQINGLKKISQKYCVDRASY